jgi:hypothetical protein
VLADGVGGMPHGADASRAAVRAAERAIRRRGVSRRTVRSRCPG